MSLTMYAELEQGSDEWLEARRGLITASAIGKLITPGTLKIADNETSRSLTLTLAAERITGHVDHVYPTFDMQRGTDDEPFARAFYAEHHAPVTEVGFVVREEAKYKIGYSPDGFVGDDGLIEIKSRKPREQVRTFLTRSVPVENRAQIQCGLFVTGRSWCDYVSFAAGLPLFVTRVHADPKWFDVIEAAATQFEVDVNAIVDDYTKVTAGMPLTERRLDPFEEIRF